MSQEHQEPDVTIGYPLFNEKGEPLGCYITDDVADMFRLMLKTGQVPIDGPNLRARVEVIAKAKEQLGME